MKMNTVDYVSWLLLVAGGLNWGAIGAFDYSVVDEVFGVDSTASTTLYVLVGLSAVYALYMMFAKMSKK